MSSGYLYKDKPIEELAAVTSEVLTKMVGGTHNIFNLKSKGFEPDDAINFVSASPNYNNNTWGASLTTGYKYQNSDVPFVDPKSLPSFYLVKTLSGELVKQFPEENLSCDDTDTVVKFISSDTLGNTGQGITISYQDINAKAGLEPEWHLVVTHKNGNKLLDVHASSYVLIDIQAPGGDGGGGNGSHNITVIGINYHALAGGGGGASGGFVSLSAHLNANNPISITNSSTAYIFSETGFSDQLFIGKGVPGNSASTYASGTNTGITNYGTGGVSRSIYSADQNSNPTSLVDVSGQGKRLHGKSFGNNVYIIDAMSGFNGSNGKSIHGTWSAVKKATTEAQNGTSAAKNTDTNQYLTSEQYSAIRCVVGNTTNSANPGQGEQRANSTASILMGGGGGGASLMAHGGSHGGGNPGIGAGGFGGSAWCSQTEAYSALGSAGGPGAIWIYYKPLSIKAPKTEVVWSTGDATNGTIWCAITNENPFDVICVCSDAKTGTEYSQFKIPANSKNDTSTEHYQFPTWSLNVYFKCGKLTSTIKKA